MVPLKYGRTELIFWLCEKVGQSPFYITKTIETINHFTPLLIIHFLTHRARNLECKDSSSPIQFLNNTLKNA